MSFVPQLAFTIIVAIATYFLYRRISQIRKNIFLGKPTKPVDNMSERWKTMLLVALGQKKMFKKIIPAILHLFVYLGFLVINLEVLEFVIDGLAGTHRIFAPLLGDFYIVLINVFEFLAIGVLFSCIVFLIRRNIVKVKRFSGSEMKQWPTMDANLILIIEIILMFAILTMNATDSLIQEQDDHYFQTGAFFFSQYLMPVFDGMSLGNLILIERSAWWFHIIGILGFAVYVTYSKHLHIALAFPNTFYSNLNTKGKNC